MKLSTKGRYAVTAMMDLALHADRGPVTLAEISQVQGISLSYLEQLFASLRRQGLVSGVRGPGGGYRLGRNPGEISVASIITAVDDAANPGRSDGGEGERCLTHELWADLSRQIYEFLDGITLEQLAREPGLDAIGARAKGGQSRRQSGSAA